MVSATNQRYHPLRIGNKFQTAINAPIHGQIESFVLKTIEESSSTLQSKSCCRSELTYKTRV